MVLCEVALSDGSDQGLRLGGQGNGIWTGMEFFIPYSMHRDSRASMDIRLWWVQIKNGLLHSSQNKQKII